MTSLTLLNPEPESEATTSGNTIPVNHNPAANASAANATDPYAAENFISAADAPKSIDDLTIELKPPSDEEFVRVSPDSKHTIMATLLEVSREEGFGKSYFLLTPNMREWVSNQPSLKKFVKLMHLFLYLNQDGEYAVWPVKDSFNSWSTSDLQVVEAAKKVWVRRYTMGKVRKAHTTNSITTEIEFPDKGMTGADGILKVVFGEAFLISSVDHPVIRKLVR
jgi:hypothetical protein